MSEVGLQRIAKPEAAGLPTQADVLAWVTERWPDRADVVWRAMKFGEESGEVLGAVVKESIGLKTMADVETESAQAAICLMALAEAAGFDLRAAIATEWEACATQVWEEREAAACEWCGRAVKQNAEGHWYAVKGRERGYESLICEASDDRRHSP